MEQTTINQRLNLVVDTFEKGKKASFARKAGISPQGAQELLAGRKGDPSFKVLLKILESYPQIHTEWLVRGLGDMLKEEVPKEQLPVKPKEAVRNALSDGQNLDEHRKMIEQIRKNSEEVMELRDVISALTEGFLGFPVLKIEEGSELAKALKRLPETLKINMEGRGKNAKDLTVKRRDDKSDKQEKE